MTTEWPDKPIVVTDDSFDETVNSYPLVVVDFWAPWCRPCLILGPLIEELAGEYQGKIAFGKLNIDENRAVPLMHNIMGIPTLLFFSNGELVNTVVGALPKQDLETHLKALL